jgi:hypothetical protein
MIRFYFAIISVFCGLSAFATQQDTNDIMNLAEQVKLAARTTQASSADLQEAKDQLREVLAILNQSGSSHGDPNGACFDFAYSKYFLSQNSQTATDNALSACRKIQDLPVAQFLYEKYYLGLASAAAMDRAAGNAGANLVAKVDMLQYAYDQYYIAMASTHAADRAANQIALVRRGNLTCLQNLFQKYYQTMTAPNAMDAAVKGCQ